MSIFFIPQGFSWNFFILNGKNTISTHTILEAKTKILSVRIFQNIFLNIFKDFLKNGCFMHFSTPKMPIFWCFSEHAQYAKYKIMAKVSYFLNLQAMAFSNIYTCMGFLLMTKSVLHVEAMCVPPEKGSRPLTVVCYLKERLFWGFFQKKSIFFEKIPVET